jgi:hypothetical protein
MSKTGTCWYIAQLATAPAVVAGTGFNPVALGAPPVAGNELNQAGAALLTTAGAYYAKKVGATTAQCNATYPSATAAPDSATGFKWGSSFSNAGVD